MNNTGAQGKQGAEPSTSAQSTISTPPQSMHCRGPRRDSTHRSEGLMIERKMNSGRGEQASRIGSRGRLKVGRVIDASSGIVVAGKVTEVRKLPAGRRGN